jgi:hypothetical protein
MAAPPGPPSPRPTHPNHCPAIQACAGAPRCQAMASFLHGRRRFRPSALGREIMRYADVRHRFGPSQKNRGRVNNWPVNVKTILSPPSLDDGDCRNASPFPTWPQAPTLGPEQATKFTKSATSAGPFTAHVDCTVKAQRRRRAIALVQALLHRGAGRIVRCELVGPAKLKGCGPADWPPRSYGPAEPEEGTIPVVTWKPYVGHGDKEDGPDWAAWWSNRRGDGDSAARRTWPLQANN